VNIPCPTCGYQVAMDHADPDGTLACPKCNANLPETALTDRTVLNPNEREARNILRAARYLAIALALVALASTIVGNGPIPGLNVFIGFLVTALVTAAFATFFYMAEQLLLIKAYLRAKAD
jgi:hypothetical protein